MSVPFSWSDPGRYRGIELQVMQFNNNSIRHEVLHVQNYAQSFGDDIQVSATAENCAIALEQAEAKASREQQRRLASFYNRASQIDKNPDRNIGTRLLSEIDKLIP